MKQTHLVNSLCSNGFTTSVLIAVRLRGLSYLYLCELGRQKAVKTLLKEVEDLREVQQVPVWDQNDGLEHVGTVKTDG